MNRLFKSNPLYSDRFSHTDRSNKHGITHYIFERVTGWKFPNMTCFCPWILTISADPDELQHYAV